MKYINLEKTQQAKFLRIVKSNTNYTWEKLSKKLGVSRGMIYNYLNENSKLSHEKYLKLCNLAKIHIKADINTVIIKNMEVAIRIPRLSSKLAEFIGALAGDGHLGQNSHEVSITLDKDLDQTYSNYIIVLFEELFGILARKKEQENKVKCYCYSKALVKYLSRTYKIPIGKKKGKLNIPKQIFAKEKLLKTYIRGLFDTDGSIHRHRPKDVMIGIFSRDPTFLDEVKKALEKLDFNPSLSGKNLYIYRKEQIDKFFKEITPSNFKHQFKYNHYKKFGSVPLTKTLVNR